MLILSKSVYSNVLCVFKSIYMNSLMCVYACVHWQALYLSAKPQETSPIKTLKNILLTAGPIPGVVLI